MLPIPWDREKDMPLSVFQSLDIPKLYSTFSNE